MTAPIAYANDIGGGWAVHCAACHAAVLAEPSNAGVEFSPLYEPEMIGQPCECCGAGFTDCGYCGALAGEPCAADCATYFRPFEGVNP